MGTPVRAARLARLALPLLVLPLFAGACASGPRPDPAAGLNVVTMVDAEAEKAAIRAVVAGMEAAWNRGDFRAYMAAFKKPDVVFISKGEVQKDWQGTLDHYIRDYGGDPARRGRLHFWDLRIEILADDAAMLTGRYRLEGGGRPQDGINTRLFRKVGGKWVIALNHVSSKEP
ncbi:MAG: hypothetical protein QOJ91_2933 [Sphingomonadales bacterium]|jgi:uncharacterized protein (TIGR02246 family)|nr:hypothetical protein [Sphingomonadales bacterium]